MWYNVIIKASLPFKAFLQSVGLASYILLVSQFLQNASKLGNLSPDLASTLFLLLFVASALISALLIFTRREYPAVLQQG